MSVKPDLKAWKNLGIDIRLTDNGIDFMSLMIADGCPRIIAGNNKKENGKCIKCKAETVNKANCKKCWEKWLNEHNMINMEEN